MSTGAATGPVTMATEPTTAPDKRPLMQQKLPGGKRDTKKLTDFDDPKFKDIDENVDQRRGGAKIEPLLLEASRHCHKHLPDGDFSGKVIISDLLPREQGMWPAVGGATKQKADSAACR